jgi:DNA glycosylase AlkZ-like
MMGGDAPRDAGRRSVLPPRAPVAAETLTRRQLNRATLARQMLLARERVSPVEAVERLCGMQAQEARPPFIGLWTRVEGFRREQLGEALHRREVVRAPLARATLHLMSARDCAAYRMAFQPVMSRALQALGARAAGLEMEALLEVAGLLLRERPHTFDELRGRLAEVFPEVDERVLGYAVRTHLPLVMVPTGDRWCFPPVADFALAETWLAEPLSHEVAPQALVRRYLAAFGPATAADMQTWSGLQGMRSVLAAMRPELLVLRDERGRELLDLPDAPRPDPDVAAPPRFLPDFDNLLLAHADRTRVVADEHRASLVTGNLRVRATFLWDGFVRGTWSVERRRSTATLRITPFEALPEPAARQLAGEGEALLRFVEDDATGVEVRIG